MDGYAADVERMMRRLFGSLKENDRRRYAAIEAAKLGHGGIEYVASVLGCDPKTIRVGLAELGGADELDTSRSRKKTTTLQMARNHEISTFQFGQ
jgi:hypothetical protein